MARGGTEKEWESITDKKVSITIILTNSEKSLLNEIAERNNLSESAAVSLIINEAYRKMVLEPDYKSPDPSYVE